MVCHTKQHTVLINIFFTLLLVSFLNSQHLLEFNCPNDEIKSSYSFLRQIIKLLYEIDKLIPDKLVTYINNIFSVNAAEDQVGD